ncbi:MAG: SDR family oxidoreductase [Chloroflexota bacterium]
MNHKPAINENRLDGKVIVVTGSTSGTGRAIALRAAWLGAKGVLVTGRNADRGEATVDEIEKIGLETGVQTDAVFVKADLTNPDDCATLMAVCDKKFGRVDGLVNSAGRGERGTLSDTSVALWDEMMNLHVRAPFLLMQFVTEIMRREGIAGSIINIGSVAAHGGLPSLTPYSVSKGALMTLTRNAAQSLIHDHIRVYCLNIGWTATEQEHLVQTGIGQPEEWLEAADATRPLGRILRPGDIAPMVTFLLSSQASMVTGSVIEWDQTMIMGPRSE